MANETTFTERSRQLSLVRYVLVCDMQRLIATGVKALLGEHSHLKFAKSTESLSDTLNTMAENGAEVIIVDKAFGIDAICG